MLERFGLRDNAVDDARDVDAVDLLTHIIERRGARDLGGRPGPEKRSVARRRVWRIRCALGAPVVALERVAASSAWTLPAADVARLAVAALQAMPTTIPSMRSLEIRGPWTSTPFERLSAKAASRRLRASPARPRAHRSPPQTTPVVKTRAPSVLPVEIRTVCILASRRRKTSPRIADGKSGVGERFSKLRKMAVKTKTRVSDDSPRADDFRDHPPRSTTSMTVNTACSPSRRRRIASNDGFTFVSIMGSVRVSVPACGRDYRW